MADSNARLVLFGSDDANAPYSDHDAQRFSESELLALLAREVAYLLGTRRDWLLGKLYRLDVRERDIKAALAVPQADVPTALATLIVARQRERAAVKAQVCSTPFDARNTEAGDLSW